MLCPNCSNDNREGAKFCDECGYPLAVAVDGGVGVASSQIADSAEGGEGLSNAKVLDALDNVTALIPDISQPEDAAAVSLPEIEVEASGLSSGQAETPSEDATIMLPEVADDNEGSDHLDDDVVDQDATVALDVDLSGFDYYESGERLVEPGYREPVVDWRDGGTMKMPGLETDQPSKSKDYLASSTKKKDRKKTVALVVAAIAVLLAAVAAFATYQMQLWGGIVVPDVTGMTEADARNVLEEAGFSVRTTQVKSDETEGLVLIMDPEASSRADEGSEIVIHIATTRTVPDIVGKQREEAEVALAEEGYANVSVTTQRSDEAPGTVLSVTPEAGTRAKSVQEVLVIVAEPYVVPDVSGMYMGDAQVAFSEAGVQVEFGYVNTIDYPDGTVISTDPTAGSEVKSDTVVWANVARARGPELVSLTSSYLSEGSSVAIGIYNYEIISLDSVEYLGDDTVAFTMTARPFTYILGETVYISARQISGQIVWTDDNQISAIY